jgi:hypothetical protein
LDDDLAGNVGADLAGPRGGVVAVLGMVAVLPEHGVNVTPPPLCPTARHIVPVVVGVVVAAELELPLILEDREPNSARRHPLGEVALRRRQPFPPPLDVLIEQRPHRWNGGDGVPAGRHMTAVQQVPHRRDEDRCRRGSAPPCY